MLTQHTIKTPYMVGPVHCYSGVLAGELVLFDTGPPTMEALVCLSKQLDLSCLRHVVVTHCHIDHYGQARWLEENTGANVYLPYRDCLKIEQHERRMAEMYEMLASLGFPAKGLVELQQVFASGQLFPPFPRRFLPVESELPATLGIEVLNCAGHSQSDLVYTTNDFAVTGDVLLEGIFQSPLLDVDLDDGGRFFNYRAYCQSLVRLAGLRGKNICPGHRERVEDVDRTLIDYVEKLMYRVQQLQAVRDTDDLMILIHRLVGDRLNNPFHLYLKLSEVIFMLDLLDSPQLLGEALHQTGLMDRVAPQYQNILN